MAMYKNKFITLILIVLLSGCYERRYQVSLNLDGNRELLPLRAKKLLNKDTIVCYSGDFLLRRDYKFPKFTIFFIYKDKSDFFLESYMGYYNLNKVKRARKKNQVPGQTIHHRGPFKIQADQLFNYFIVGNLDTISTIPRVPSDGSDHNYSAEALFLKIGSDSIQYYMDYDSYISDSTHAKSYLLKLTSETIKSANIKFRKKKIKDANGVIVEYDW